ncbi:MAG: TfoX/Sxy family protein [Rhodobacteraceae bacterium]|nr:TfoX/Sxy family protein [Paracoccaceae bacterium]
MAYDENLAQDFRDLVEGLPDLSEKKMMGGVCFMLSGNMIGGADLSKTGQKRFMFRVGKPNTSEAEAIGHGEPLVQGGRLMSGFYFVDAEDTPEHIIRKWVSLAVSHAMSLPPKTQARKAAG